MFEERITPDARQARCFPLVISAPRLNWEDEHLAYHLWLGERSEVEMGNTGPSQLGSVGRGGRRQHAGTGDGHQVVGTQVGLSFRRQGSGLV